MIFFYMSAYESIIFFITDYQWGSLLADQSLVASADIWCLGTEPVQSHWEEDQSIEETEQNNTQIHSEVVQSK